MGSTETKLTLKGGGQKESIVFSRGTSGITVISFSQAEFKNVQIITLNLVHILLWQALITSQNFKGSPLHCWGTVYFINVLSEFISP